jgi:pimeloyl-ACP methyl ester carboxylesterase
LYTHQNALADLRAVIDRLAYSRVNLWGGSWGTRSALIFASRYPDLVRTVTLDGAVAATMDFPYSYPLDAARVLDLLLAACESDPACARAFPNARAVLAGWLEGLERQAFDGMVRHPRSGEPMHLRLGRDSATEILRAALYSPIDTSRLLNAVERAANGDPSMILAMAERAAGWSLDTMALGQTHAILCSEDVGRHPPPQPRDTIFGTSAVDGWLGRCAAWPRGPSLDIDHRTVLSTPALILSGALDPVTPPARGEAMRHHFPNSLHVVVPGGGHNVSFSGCLPRLIAAFVEQADPQSLDASCAQAVTRPPFVISAAGEQP